MNRINMLALNSDVRIQPVTLEHAENMFRWICDPFVALNIGLRQRPSMEKTIEWIKLAVSSPSTRAFAITLAGKHTGNVVLDQIDNLIGSARLSVYIGEASCRGAGVARTATWLALKEAFHTLCLHKVWLVVHVNNVAAIRIYIRIGFVVEGILRDEFLFNTERISVLRMSILKDEFDRAKIT